MPADTGKLVCPSSDRLGHGDCPIVGTAERCVAVEAPGHDGSWRLSQATVAMATLPALAGETAAHSDASLQRVRTPAPVPGVSGAAARAALTTSGWKRFGAVWSHERPSKCRRLDEPVNGVGSWRPSSCRILADVGSATNAFRSTTGVVTVAGTVVHSLPSWQQQYFGVKKRLANYRVPKSTFIGAW